MAQWIDALLLRIDDDLHSHHVVFREELQKDGMQGKSCGCDTLGRTRQWYASYEIITVPVRYLGRGWIVIPNYLSAIAVLSEHKGRHLEYGGSG